MTAQIALASCERMLAHPDPDEDLLVAACTARGLEVSVLAWTDPTTQWQHLDATIIRSTWDYTDRPAEYDHWLQSTPRLHNPASVVSANLDKTYLARLASAGLPIVPTSFAEPGDSVVLPETGEYVLKPSVGAGSRGAARFGPQSQPAALAHAKALQDAGRTVMIQPYLHQVDEVGETGMIFIDGEFSHAICKAAMLPAGSQHGLDSGELYVAERITAKVPAVTERELASAVLQSYDFAEPLLYARVDLLPTSQGPVVIEVELNEPSLFLSYCDGAAAMLAAAISGRLS